MNEEDLLRKLAAIEALFAGAKSEGERDAAEQAKTRIRQRLLEFGKVDPPIEYKFTLSNQWSRRLLVALMRRYEIRPYRYRRQRYTTVMARVSKSFVDQTLWPEFTELDNLLQRHLDEVADGIIGRAIHPETAEAEFEERALKG
jgi:DNA-directed RNA polymerase subunit K/omega